MCNVLVYSPQKYENRKYFALIHFCIQSSSLLVKGQEIPSNSCKDLTASLPYVIRQEFSLRQETQVV